MPRQRCKHHAIVFHCSSLLALYAKFNSEVTWSVNSCFIADDKQNYFYFALGLRLVSSRYATPRYLSSRPQQHTVEPLDLIKLSARVVSVFVWPTVN